MCLFAAYALNGLRTTVRLPECVPQPVVAFSVEIESVVRCELGSLVCQLTAFWRVCARRCELDRRLSTLPCASASARAAELDWRLFTLLSTMGAAYSSQHVRVYSAERLQSLERYNELVPAFFWTGIGAMLLAQAAVRIAASVMSWRRRRKAWLEMWEGGRLLGPGRNPDSICWRHLGAASVAVFRKLTINQPRWLEPLCMGGVGSVLLLTTCASWAIGSVADGADLTLCLGLMYGRQVDPDWTAHHAAMLCFAQLRGRRSISLTSSVPLIVGLSSKNSIITLITGIPYEVRVVDTATLTRQRLNLLHRWSSRMFVVLASVHVGGRLYVNDPDTRPSGDGRGYIRAGWVGFIAFVLLVAAASRPIRNMRYATFKITHFVLVLVALTGMFVHRPERLPWLVAGLALWALDRMGRTLRVLVRHVWHPPKSTSGQSLAFVEALSEDTGARSRFWRG